MAPGNQSPNPSYPPPPPATDAKSYLLHRVASGDPSAVKELTRRYGGLVYALSRRMNPNQADIEDAVQDVFIAVWKAAGKYDPSIGSEDTFVSMLCRRRLIDRRRRAVRRSVEHATEDFSMVSSAASPASSGNAFDDPTAADSATTSEDAKRAMHALTTLRPEQQQVLRLSIGKGFSHEQIAELLSMPLGTVKTHARRGLLAIREIMNQKVNPNPPDRERPNSPT